MATPLNTLLSWFETGDFPTQAQFQASWSSFWHKDESIPMSQVSGLAGLFEQTASAQALSSHLNDSNAHAGYLAKLDASNLTAAHVNAWKNRLGVDEIPANTALVDMGQSQSVYNKEQINSLCMLLENYVNSDGKIMSGMIEALGLTELITVTQTSLASFMADHANYTYEKNDMIAIPDGAGNYSLYIYKGGSKTAADNYIPTGLTNLTIAMVQGLQAALDGKMNKPAASGNYYARYFLGQVSWAAINPASGYLLFWNGNDFTGSRIYTDGTKFGIGTTAPAEMLHLSNGRIRSKAVVFDENTETLPYQITHSNRRYYGSDLTGAARMFMYRDYADYKALWEGFTDAQKNEIKTIANGGWTTNTMSVAIITPPIAAKQDTAQWFVMRGANLNLNPAGFAVYLVDAGGTEFQVPNSQVQLYTSGLDLSFWYNFKDFALGTYKVKLWNGAASYTTGASVTITLVSNVTPIDFSGMTWEKVSTTPAQVNNTINASGTTVSHYPNSGNAPYTEFETVVCAAKSGTIISDNENFYLKASVTVGSGRLTSWGNIIGVGLSSNPLTLVNSSQAFSKIKQNNDSSSMKYGWADMSSSLISGGFNIGQFQSIPYEVMIMRNQGIYTIIVSTGSVSATFVKSGSNGALSLLYYGFSAADIDGITPPTACTSSVSFIEGYKF
ncbi:hypothetical protein [Chryseobacterium sp. ZHDP1]|uniref:hypothetical protein n=1 Tax=Chryseobacterium sp. ZHDP1 TaxID=2838877 RepID=UPI001BDFAF6E|nr:hypothetical protein [Chryseobacterium sp. ZHDP1]QWA37252.1 hypothetical protein KKI44_15100 [Chryseobacterium sp. ZHDP1]